MKIFIWSRISTATYNYHSEGGVVVIAEDEPTARRIANEICGCQIAVHENPDVVRECSDWDAAVFIFPDAGCC